MTISDHFTPPRSRAARMKRVLVALAVVAAVWGFVVAVAASLLYCGLWAVFGWLSLTVFLVALLVQSDRDPSVAEEASGEQKMNLTRIAEEAE